MPNNFINRLGRDNLNTLGDVSILDIYLSKGHVVEPHYHPNAAELVLVRRALEPLHNETIIIGPTDAFI